MFGIKKEVALEVEETLSYPINDVVRDDFSRAIAKVIRKKPYHRFQDNTKGIATYHQNYIIFTEDEVDNIIDNLQEEISDNMSIADILYRVSTKLKAQNVVK